VRFLLCMRPMRSFLTLGMIFVAASSFAEGGANSVLSLSHYDERVLDFPEMQREGLEGVIHEATYPSFDHDSRYARRQAEVARAGLRWGAYHFGNSADGARQADHFLDFVSSEWSQGGSRASGVLLVLDAEQNTHYPGGSMPVEQALHFVKRVKERTGLYPGLYSNENWIRKVFNNPAVDSSARQILSRCWLWIANYHDQPASTAPWARWNMWQYTGDGICGLPRSRFPTTCGNYRNAERTVFNGDRSTLRHFWSEHSWLPGHALTASAQ
jgi:lysozyme